MIKYFKLYFIDHPRAYGLFLKVKALAQGNEKLEGGMHYTVYLYSLALSKKEEIDIRHLNRFLWVYERSAWKHSSEAYDYMKQLLGSEMALRSIQEVIEKAVSPDLYKELLALTREYVLKYK